MAKNGSQINVGRDFQGNSIQGDGNTIVHNEIDSEEFGQSLGEALSESERDRQWQERFYESEREDSRQIMETVFVSLVSVIAIGACWKFAFPWNAETVPFFVIATIVLFNVLKITHFGLRRSIFKVLLLSAVFSLILKYTSLPQTWIEINQFAGTLILATLGAIIGLFVGIIQTFWHPWED